MKCLEKIRDMPKEELAKLLIKEKDEEIWDYDYDENPEFLYIETLYYHPFSSCSFIEYDEALEDCIKCLDKEFKGFNIDYDE